MTWHLASAPLIPLSSLGYEAGRGAPEDGPSPISKAWPDSGLLSLTEVCPAVPPHPPSANSQHNFHFPTLSVQMPLP